MELIKRHLYNFFKHYSDIPEEYYVNYLKKHANLLDPVFTTKNIDKINNYFNSHGYDFSINYSKF